ncbi:hypothetical protein [Lewinella sp. LCG006]|uniref:hypothetical protein n=1 Tax=Lewinella sp. LCG006 TaxID=3231911 RepID=UPI003460E753
MSKTYFCILLILMVVGVSCLTNSIGQQVEKNDLDLVEIYYLPWDYRTEGRLSEKEVRDTVDVSISFFCSKQETLLSSLKMALNESNFREFEELDYVEPYMIIDIIYESKEKETITLNRRQLGKFRGKSYFFNASLSQWIEQYVPKATFPIGSRNSNCL